MTRARVCGLCGLPVAAVFVLLSRFLSPRRAGAGHGGECGGGGVSVSIGCE